MPACRITADAPRQQVSRAILGAYEVDTADERVQCFGRSLAVSALTPIISSKNSSCQCCGSVRLTCLRIGCRCGLSTMSATIGRVRACTMKGRSGRGIQNLLRLVHCDQLASSVVDQLSRLRWYALMGSRCVPRGNAELALPWRSICDVVAAIAGALAS